MTSSNATLFQRLHHVCIVVNDLDRAQGFYESVGIGPWQDYPPLAEYTDLDVPNRDAFLGMRYRFANIDNVQIQLCQPPMENCPQRQFLKERGEGVYHLGFVVSDCDAAESEASDLGLSMLMRGRRPEGSGFAYFDTSKDAGVVLEVRKSPGDSQ